MENRNDDIELTIWPGAIVKHPVFGKGQVATMIASFSEHKWCETPFLIGFSDELTIDPNGLHLNHERFGYGDILGYEVIFKSHKLYFKVQDFAANKVIVLPNPENG